MALTPKTFAELITFTRASSATRINASGALESMTINQPRIDHDPITLAVLGLLIEEQRTNSIRNNTMQGAVAGSPGTMPTNWSGWTGTASGVSSSIANVGTEDGVSYVDIRFQGTSTATGTVFSPAFDSAAVIPASNGQTWTESAYLKLVGGSLADVTVNFRMTNQSSAGLGDSPSLAIGSALQRHSYTLAVSDAAITGIAPRLRIALVTGKSYDFTLRIGLPQLELGAFATSVIRTTTAAATRAADVASINTLSPWFNPVEGTLNVTASVLGLRPDGGTSRLCSFDNASGPADYMTIRSGTVINGGDFYAFTNNTAVVDTNSFSITPGVSNKYAYTYKLNDFAYTMNGANPLTDTSGAVPSVSRFVLGGASFSGHIRSVSYYPKRLTNTELQALTS